VSTTSCGRTLVVRAVVGASLACAAWAVPATAGVAATSEPPPATSAAPDSSSFGLQPASAEGPDSRTSLTYDVIPGQVIDDHVALTNDTSRPLLMRLFATDATTTTEGGFVLLPSGQRPIDAGAWVRFDSAATVTVPARMAGSPSPSTVVVPFRLTVPADAAPGDHVGGVVVAVASTSTDSRGQQSALERRAVTRLLIRVAGATRPELAIDDLRIDYAASANLRGTGVATVSYTVHNTGNVTVGGQQSVSIAGLWGPVADVRGPGLSPMVPGSSLKVVIVVPDAPQGLSDTVTVTVLPQELRPGAGPGAPSAAVAAVASKTFVAVPWTAMAVAAVLVVILVIGVRTSRRRRRSRLALTSVPKPRTASAARHSRP